MKRKFTFFVLLLLISYSGFSQTDFAGGDGTSGSPWQIVTPEHLDALRLYLGSEHNDKYFILMNDIDLTDYLAEGGAGYDSWGAAGWEPIGSSMSVAFAGNLDGNGNVVKGLWIDRPAETYIGLFGYVNEGTVQNIGLVGVDVSGKELTAGLVGLLKNGTVLNSFSVGFVKAQVGNYVGGLVGLSAGGNITDSHADVDVDGGTNSSAYNGIGGLVGNNNGTISNCYAKGDVTAGASVSYVGGLVGICYGSYGANAVITQSYATGDVTAGSEAIGGLVGYASEPGSETASITQCFATGDVHGEGANKVGGLIGDNQTDVNVSDCYALGTVYGDTRVGGVIGYNAGIAENCYFGASLSTTGSYIGALSGMVFGTFQNSYWDQSKQVSAIGYFSSGAIVSGNTGYTTAEMQGSTAATNLSLLDFTNIWETVEAAQADVSADGYPILQGIDRTKQLIAQELTTSYPLLIDASPVDAGNVLGEGNYEMNEVVYVVAKPALGYAFVNWTGSIPVEDATSKSTQLTMPPVSATLTANFTLVDYNISISASPAEGGTYTGDGTANYGDETTVTATPATGYEFVNWTGDTEHLDDATAASATLTMPAADVSLTANFQLIDYTIGFTASPAEGGTYTGDGTANYGDETTVTATPATGYEFVNWTGDTEHLDDATVASATLTMPAADVSLTANFQLVDYTIGIMASPAEGGTYTGDGTANYGDETTVTATPATGYEFVNWTGDTEHLDDATVASATLTMPAADVSLTANFQLIDYTIGFTASPAEGGTYTGDGTANYGDETTVTATPATGYEFVNWTGDTEHLDDATAASATLTMPAADVSLTANFQLIDYSIGITASPAEGGTYTGDGTANYGDETTVTATPATGYEFVNWTGDTEHLDDATAASATLTMPSADVSLTANFQLIDYSIGITASPAEGGTYTGDGTANYGDETTVTATPATGYEFVNWTGDAGHLDDATAANATLTMPAADVSLTANFELTTGIDIANKADLKVYPNPVDQGWLMVEAEKNLVKATIYGLDGKMQWLQIEAEGKHLELDISQLDPGYYILQLTTKEGTKLHKKVLKK